LYQWIKCPVAGDFTAGETDLVFEITTAALGVDADPIGFKLIKAFMFAGTIMPLSRAIHAIVIASTAQFPSD
jgi:hypothetical protein